MWNHTNQSVTPVVAAECHLLSRGIFQRTVGSEMDKCIGTETITSPEIRGNIGVRRCLVGAMHNLEGVASHACHHLWKQCHITELQSCHRQLTVIGSHIFAREGTIELVHLLDHLLRQSLLGPSGKLLGGNQGRMSRLEELGISTLGIGSEDGTLSLNHLCQFLRIGWQLAYIVSFILQANQEIVERWNHFHSRSGECILTRTLEVEDGDALAAVLLVLQIHIALHALHETLHSVWDAVNLLQALLVDALSENHVWTDGTINLRSHDALRHETAIHSLLVVLPIGGQAVDIKR